ncbi:MAG TPA: DUF2252 family protein [Candidatus Acidoferrum sp.]|jgi:hypothetical protein|nr:DUF2252 family protein [Candidatus Acidoferrum sp.]
MVALEKPPQHCFHHLMSEGKKESTGLPNIHQATSAYESWLGRQMPLLPADLKLKHSRMAESPFAFLRATFYRWRQLWPRLCPELMSSPEVLGVGDLHVENFGTWRDAEGRLVWGVNDFDEACRLPYPNDLVRLAVSAQLAARENQRLAGDEEICETLLAGYAEAMQSGGRPFVLAERHHWLREMAISELRDPIRFWGKLNQWPSVGQAVPAEVRAALRRAMPEAGLPLRVVHRQAGLGSLGRRRFTALAEWCGGLVAREAKELAPSAWNWEAKQNGKSPLLYAKAIQQAVRVADPFVGFQKQWLLRRLAPDCSRIELASLLAAKDVLKLLQGMGWETANVHLGDRKAVAALRKELRTLPASWLRKASAAMLKATLADWENWRARL